VSSGHVLRRVSGPLRAGFFIPGAGIGPAHLSVGDFAPLISLAARRSLSPTAANLLGRNL
jgi:hypothetical protein